VSALLLLSELLSVLTVRIIECPHLLAVTPYYEAHRPLCHTISSILKESRRRGTSTRVIMCEEHGAPIAADVGGSHSHEQCEYDARLQSTGQFFDSAFEDWQEAAGENGLKVEPLLPTVAMVSRDGRHGGRLSWDLQAFSLSIPFLTEVTLL
jgi:hypothetical protein